MIYSNTNKNATKALLSPLPKDINHSIKLLNHNEKIERLSAPKNFSIRTALIAVNGVSEQVVA